ncbi:MAG: hypothetical protein IPK00_14395 [Deltaproteobacteria bacterium]|nr:hypothetical protein [Deltaproteobacteria bacterium]
MKRRFGAFSGWPSGAGSEPGASSRSSCRGSPSGSSPATSPAIWPGRSFTSFTSGAGAALAAAGALAALGRRGAVVAIPVALALVCVGSELLLSPEIAALRPSTLGAANTEETQTRFRLLHGISLGLFMLIHLTSVALLGRVAWLETRDRAPATPPTEGDS